MANGAYTVGNRERAINDLISIDGYKFVFEDASWLMIRASGTEPKVRFYVEGRSTGDRDNLFKAARQLLSEIGLSWQ